MKRISGYVRSVPGGDPLLNIPVTVYDALTGLTIPTGGIYGADASPVNTHASTGYFEWKTELDPGPLYIEAVTGVGQKKVRASVEQMPAYGIYISDIVEYFTVFSDGVASGRGNNFNATAAAKTVTLQTGASIVAGRWLETLTNRAFTAADNTTLAERWDALILRQHIGGTALGRQEIVLVQGTVSGVLPAINTDPNKRDVLLWTVKLAQNAGSVTLVDNRTYTSYTIPANSIAPSKLTAAGQLSTAEIVQVLRAPTSGVEPVFDPVALGELNDVSASAPASGNTLSWNGSLWVPTAHDHSATFAPIVHNHDTSYYTEAEMDALLAGKSATGHIHDDRYYTEAEVDALVAGAGGLDDIDVYSNGVLATGIATALNFASNFQVTSELAGARALIAPIFGTGATNFAQGDHTHTLAGHSHGGNLTRFNVTVKDYVSTAVSGDTLCASVTISLSSSITYDVLIVAMAAAHMTANPGNVQLGVRESGGTTDWGSKNGTLNGERPVFAAMLHRPAATTSVTYEMRGRVTDGAGSGAVLSGIIFALAIPKDSGSVA